MTNLRPDWVKLTRMRFGYLKYPELNKEDSYKILILDTKHAVLTNKMLKVVGRVLVTDLEIIKAYAEK